MGEIIANGKPLPKGHGRLIDVNDLLDDINLENNDYNRDVNTGEIITLENIDRIPTVIEADKESKTTASDFFSKEFYGEIKLTEQSKKDLNEMFKDLSVFTADEIKYIDKKTGEVAEFVSKSKVKSDWIPCSEQLPDNEEEMLVTYIAKGKKYVHLAFYSKDEDGGGVWLGYNNDDDYQQPIKNVIAWQPKPKAYTEGEGGGLI